MLPINRQNTETLSVRKKKNDYASSSSPGKLSAEQLRSMAAPKRISSLQWDLSNSDERRALLVKNIVLEDVLYDEIIKEEVDIETVKEIVLKDSQKISPSRSNNRRMNALQHMSLQQQHNRVVKQQHYSKIYGSQSSKAFHQIVQQAEAALKTNSGKIGQQEKLAQAGRVNSSNGLQKATARLDASAPVIISDKDQQALANSIRSNWAGMTPENIRKLNASFNIENSPLFNVSRKIKEKIRAIKEKQASFFDSTPLAKEIKENEALLVQRVKLLLSNAADYFESYSIGSMPKKDDTYYLDLAVYIADGSLGRKTRQADSVAGMTDNQPDYGNLSSDEVLIGRYMNGQYYDEIYYGDTNPDSFSKSIDTIKEQKQLLGEASSSIAERMIAPVDPANDGVDQPSFEAHINQLIKDGKYGQAANLIRDFMAKEEKNLTALGTTAQYEKLAASLSRLGGIYSNIVEGDFTEVHSILSALQQELDGLSTASYGGHDIGKTLSTHTRQLINAFNIASPTPVSMGFARLISKVDALYRQGKVDQAADMVIAIANSLEVNQPGMSELLNNKAAEMRATTEVTVDIEVSADVQKAVDQLEKLLNQPRGEPELVTDADGTSYYRTPPVVITTGQVTDILDLVPDAEYGQFLIKIKQQGLLDKLINMAKPNPMFVYLGPTTPDTVIYKHRLYELLAEKGVNQVQTDDWFVNNVITIVPNTAQAAWGGIAPPSAADNELKGTAMLAQFEGHEDLAAKLFAVYGGKNGVLLPLTFPNSAAYTFVLAVRQTSDALKAKWNTADEAGKRDLVASWVESGEAEAISTILGVNFAAYQAAEGPAGEASVEITLGLAGSEIEDITKSLDTLNQRVDTGLKTAREKEIDKLMNPWADEDDVFASPGLSHAEGRVKVAQKESELIDKYSAMSDAELDEALASFKLSFWVSDSDGEDMGSLVTPSRLGPMIAFREKIKRLQNQLNTVSTQAGDFQSEINTGQSLTTSHINGLRDQITVLDGLVFGAERALNNYENGTAGRAISDKELEAFGKQVEASSEAFNKAIEGAKTDLGEDIDRNWVFKPNANLVEKAQQLKADLRKFHQMMSTRTDTKGIDKTLKGLEESIEGVNGIIIAQRMSVENAQWIENFSIDMLSEAAALSFGDVKIPAAVRAAETDFNAVINELKATQNDDSVTISRKMAVMGRIRISAIELKQQLETFSGSVENETQKKVLRNHIRKLDDIIEKLRPALGSNGEPVTSAELRQQLGTKLQQMAIDNPESFKKLVSVVFGVTDSAKLDQLLRKAQGDNLDWIPEIRAVKAGILNGKSAAYAAKQDIIYLNEDLLQMPSEAFKMVLEELGHSIDVQVNGEIDTAGDEGELFARLLSGEKLTAEQVLAIRSENDTGTILVDGVEISVEFGNLFEDLGDFFQGFIDSVVSFVEKIVDVLGDMIEGIGDALVTIVNTPVFQIVALGLSLFVPGSQAALIAAYAQAGAAIHLGIQNKDWGMVVQGLVTAAIATSGAAKGFEGKPPLIDLSLGTVQLLDNVVGWVGHANDLYDAIQLGEEGIAKFLIEQLGNIPDDSSFAGLKAAIKPLQLGVAYHEADDDVGRAAAILQFVGLVAGEDTVVGEIATSIGQKTEFLNKIDQAIEDKDWHKVHELTVAELGNYLSEDQLGNIDSVLFIGASLGTAEQYFDDKNWVAGIAELGAAGLSAVELIGGEELDRNLEVVSEIIIKVEKVATVVDLVEIIENLDSDNPLDIIEAVLNFREIAGNRLDEILGSAGQAVLNKIEAAIEQADEIKTAWDKGDYTGVVKHLNNFIQILVPNNTKVRGIVNQLISDVLIPAAQAVELANDFTAAIEDGDLVGVIESIEALEPFLNGSVFEGILPAALLSRIKAVAPIGKEIETAWKNNDFKVVSAKLKTFVRVLFPKLPETSSVIKAVDSLAEVVTETNIKILQQIEALDSDEAAVVVAAVIAIGALEISGKLEKLLPPALRERLGKAVKLAQEIKVNFEASDFRKVAIGLKQFIRTLTPGNTKLIGVVDKLANKYFVRTAAVLSLILELDGDRDSAKILTLVEQLLGVKLAPVKIPQPDDDGVSLPIERVVALLGQPQFRKELSDLKQAISDKDLDKIKVLTTSVAEKLKAAIEGGLIFVDEVDKVDGGGQTDLTDYRQIIQDQRKADFMRDAVFLMPHEIAKDLMKVLRSIVTSFYSPKVMIGFVSKGLKLYLSAASAAGVNSYEDAKRYIFRLDPSALTGTQKVFYANLIERMEVIDGIDLHQTDLASKEYDQLVSNISSFPQIRFANKSQEILSILKDATVASDETNRIVNEIEQNISSLDASDPLFSEKYAELQDQLGVWGQRTSYTANYLRIIEVEMNDALGEEIDLTGIMDAEALIELASNIDSIIANISAQGVVNDIRDTLSQIDWYNSNVFGESGDETSQAA